MISADQIQAARKLLGWSAIKLGSKCDRHFNTIRKAEKPDQDGVTRETLAKIRAAFEAAGVEFHEDGGGPGACLRKTA